MHFDGSDFSRRSVRTGIALTMLAMIGSGEATGADNDRLRLERSRVTGLVTFVTSRDGGAIAVDPAPGAAGPGPADFIRQYGHLFGVTDAATQLVLVPGPAPDELGHTHTSYEQRHKGVPVFSGTLRIHQDPTGGVRSANGDFYPIPDALVVQPTITAPAAADAARNRIGNPQALVERAELLIVDPGWYGDPPAGAHLAYYVIVAELAVPVREAFFIDAHSGRLLDQWTLLESAKNRAIYNANFGAILPGTLARSEGQAPVASVDVNQAYDYLGDIYDLYLRGFGRDSYDGSGGTMNASVNSFNGGCPNAYFTGSSIGSQISFCPGIVSDDLTGHELTHGLTGWTAGLIYQNLSGQLNESFSDVFGELIDLYNGNVGFAGPPAGPNWPTTHPSGPGTDTPNNLRSAAVCSYSPGHADGVRWLVFEDSEPWGGAIRDMWNPECYGNPDRANSPLQNCFPADNGGVHNGSGIPNHAFAMLVDGKTFNGFTVSPIGPIKTGAVWFRALSQYLTSVSDFQDAYLAFNQAAADLVGTFPIDPRTNVASVSMFTAADALEVDEALRAVEMDIGGCGIACQTGSCPPANDDCAVATVVGNGAHFYSTECATDDGPPSIPGGVCPGSDQAVPFTQDVWYEYMATCDGVLSVDLCGFWSGHDGVLAIYGDGSPACTCPADNTSLLGCGDDTCEIAGGPPRARAVVEAGGCYLIRVAAFLQPGGGVDGCGDMNIFCNPCPFSSMPTPDPVTPDTGFGARTRWLSFRAGDAGRRQAVRVRFVSLPAPFDVLNGATMWVQAPTAVAEAAGVVAPGTGQPSFPAATLGCNQAFLDWSAQGVVHVFDEAIVPGATYEVDVIDELCDANVDLNYSDPLAVRTSRWGDLVRNCTTNPCSSPDGNVSVTTDVVAALDKFSNRPGAPGKSRVDLEPAALDLKVNISDVTRVLDGFRGLAYPFTQVPAPCP